MEGAYIIPRSFLYRDPNTVNILNRMAEEKLSRMDLAVLPIIQKISLSYIYSNPSCSYNAEETLSVKQFAADRAEPVNSRILAGEVIVKSGEIITPEIFKKTANCEHLCHAGEHSFYRFYFAYSDCFCGDHLYFS